MKGISNAKVEKFKVKISFLFSKRRRLKVQGSEHEGIEERANNMFKKSFGDELGLFAQTRLTFSQDQKNSFPRTKKPLQGRLQL